MLTRQQRRAQEREARKRAEREAWNEGLLAVHAVSEGGAFLNYILTGPAQLEHIGLAARVGEPTGVALVEAIVGWMRRADEPDQVLPQLCLGCETAFGPGLEPPHGFAVALSFNNAAAICTGICCDCCQRDRDELAHILLGWQRKLFPDAHIMSGQCGHA